MGWRPSSGHGGEDGDRSRADLRDRVGMRHAIRVPLMR
jgi:hypothetical protein